MMLRLSLRSAIAGCVLCLSLSFQLLFAFDLDKDARSALQELGFEVFHRSVNNNCLYEAVAYQTGGTADELRRKLRYHMTVMIQEPTAASHNLMDAALNQFPLASSLEELFNFYFNGNLTREGEMGEIMLIPFMVKALNRPIMVLNANSGGMSNMPSFLIGRDLFARIISSAEQIKKLMTKDTVIIVHVNNTFYAVKRRIGQHNDWELLLDLIKNLFLQTVSDLNGAFPGQGGDPSGYPMGASHSAYDKPNDLHHVPFASGGGDEASVKLRMIRRERKANEEISNPQPEPRVEFVASYPDVSITPLVFDNQNQYLQLLLFQIYEFFEEHQEVEFSSSLEEVSDDPPGQNEGTDIESGSRLIQPAEISFIGSDLETIPEAETPEITITQSERDHPLSAKERFKKALRQISLSKLVLNKMDDRNVVASMQKTDSGVPFSYRKKLADMAVKEGQGFGNRPVSSHAKRHLEQGDATKNFRLKIKSSLAWGLQSMIPATPRLSKSAVKSPGGLRKEKTALELLINQGLVNVVEYSLPNDQVMTLEQETDPDEAVIVTQYTPSGFPNQKNINMQSRKPGMPDMVLKRTERETDWAVYYVTADGELERVRVVTDPDGRTITADIDLIAIAFKYEQLSLDDYDKLPLPLVTNELARKRVANYKGHITAESREQLARGMVDFFDATVFIETCWDVSGHTRFQPEWIKREALDEQVRLNPQLPVLKDLDKYCSAYPFSPVVFEPSSGAKITGVMMTVPREHPDMGNVNRRVCDLVKMANEEVGRSDNFAFHHNHDAHSLASVLKDNFPADMYVPVTLHYVDDWGVSYTFEQGCCVIENEAAMAAFIGACKDNDYFVTVNPKWTSLFKVRSKNWKHSVDVLKEFLPGKIEKDRRRAADFLRLSELCKKEFVGKLKNKVQSKI